MLNICHTGWQIRDCVSSLTPVDASPSSTGFEQKIIEIFIKYGNMRRKKVLEDGSAGKSGG
jgi:hypothetical protein